MWLTLAVSLSIACEIEAPGGGITPNCYTPSTNKCGLSCGDSGDDSCSPYVCPSGTTPIHCMYLSVEDDVMFEDQAYDGAYFCCPKSIRD